MVKFNLNKKYTIGGTSYILKFAGNGMTMFKDSTILQNEELSETDVIIRIHSKLSVMPTISMNTPIHMVKTA